MKDTKFIKDLSVDRLVFFSDAVFAISITLLALELKLPSGVDLKSDTAILAALANDANQFIAFAISFAVIASFWSWHVRVFRKLTQYKPAFIWLNVLMLFFIAIMPFTTSLISGPSTHVTTIIYAANISLIALAAAGTYHYAVKNNFIHEATTALQRRKRERSMLAIAGVFAVSIPIALISPTFATYFWLILIPIMRFIK